MDKAKATNDFKISLKQFCVHWARWKVLGSCADDQKECDLLGYDAVLTSKIFSSVMSVTVSQSLLTIFAGLLRLWVLLLHRSFHSNYPLKFGPTSFFSSSRLPDQYSLRPLITSTLSHTCISLRHVIFHSFHNFLSLLFFSLLTPYLNV